ncbi:MAG TPA: Mur ligase domain-containing protein, partial [Acidimicrobiales bacterium]|nr:Mur ligase domain-containing protein [Acidimicrobiales bacterium]
MIVPVPAELLPADRLGRVHFVGIGGAGLSGIARIMLARGITVSGSDAKESRTIEALRALGARCDIGHDASHVRDVDTLVVSTAVREDNPEVVEARRQGLRLLPRSAALESVMQGRRVVAVAGTHGKTTTTSLLTVALQHCAADPSFAIGGELNESGSNAHDGSGDLFVAEADESDGAFLVYSPYAALVTNVEADHLDNWGTEKAYHAAFTDFLDRISPEGFLVACVDDDGAADLVRQARERGMTAVGVGESAEADLRAESLVFAGSTSTFTVVDRGRRLGEVSLQIPGRHYVLDALAALAAGLRLGFSFTDLRRGLEAFSGTRR